MSNDGFPDTSPELSAETMPFMLGLGGWNALDLLGACGTNAPPPPSWCHQSVDTYVVQWPGIPIRIFSGVDPICLSAQW